MADIETLVQLPEGEAIRHEAEESLSSVEALQNTDSDLKNAMVLGPEMMNELTKQ